VFSPMSLLFTPFTSHQIFLKSKSEIRLFHSLRVWQGELALYIWAMGYMRYLRDRGRRVSNKEDEMDFRPKGEWQIKTKAPSWIHLVYSWQIFLLLSWAL
jgi:hypothetical protein